MSHQDPGGPAATAPPGDDARPRAGRPTATLVAALAAAGALLLAPPGCASRSGPDRDHPVEAGGPVGAPGGATGRAVAEATAAVPPPDVGRTAAGPAPPRSDPLMNFNDPQTSPEPPQLSGGDITARWGSKIDDRPTIHVWDPETDAFLAASGLAARLVNAPLQYLSAPSSPGLSPGNGGFTIAGWVYFDAVDSVQLIAGKWDQPNSRCEYLIYQNSSHFEAAVSANGVDFTIVSTDAGTAIAGTWHFLRMWHDPARGRIGIQVDGGVPAVASHAGGIQSTSEPIYFGTDSELRLRLSGRLAGWNFWGRVLDGDDRESLYNGGVGRGYHQFGAGLLSGLVSSWPFEEPAGRRADAHGPNHLVDFGGVLSAPGIVPSLSPSHAWEGAEVGSCGDLAAASPAARPIARMYPRRLELPGTRPGMTRVGPSISGRASWTHAARLHFTTSNGSGFAYESNTAADGSYLDLGIDGGGVPFVAAAGPGGVGEVVVSCPVPAFGRLNVLSGQAEDQPTVGPTAPPNHPAYFPARTRCVLVVDDLLDTAFGDFVTVSGCGAPFDGIHVLDRCRVLDATGEFEVSYLVDEPFAGTATPTRGSVVPTGEAQYGWPNWEGWDPDSPIWPQRGPMSCRLRVERDAGSGAIRWYNGGYLLGSADASSLPPGGDGTGTATVALGRPADARRDGPAVLPSYVASFDGVLDADDARALDVRLACRITGGFDYAEHPCFVDCESLPGLGRRRGAHGPILAAWVDDATGEIVGEGTVEDRTGDRRGVARSDFSAEHLGTFDQAGTTTYTLVLAYRSPRYDDRGVGQEAEWLYAGAVATATRLPYDPSRTIRVDPATGNDSNNGFAAPKATLQGACDAAGPGSLILLARDRDYAHATLTAGRGPFCVAAEPGAGARPHVSQLYQPWDSWSAECLMVPGGVVHAVVVGLHLDQDSGHLTNGGGMAILSEFTATGFSARDLLCTAPTGGYGLKIEGANYWSMADLDMPGDAAGGYCILVNGMRHMSFRRIRLDRPCDPYGSHVIRGHFCDVYHFGGITARPAIANSGSADITMRNSGRRATMDLCDWGDINAMQHGDNNLNHGHVGASRTRWTGCRMHAAFFNGSSHSYMGGCETISGGFAVGPNDGDAGRGGGDKFLAEGNTWIGSGFFGRPEPTGYPTAGPWRNINPASSATGEPLTAPAIEAIAVPGTRLVVVAAAGVAQGGALPRALALQVDGADVSGSLGMMSAARLAVGAHDARTVASDASGEAAATGIGLAFTMLPPGEASESPLALSGPTSGVVDRKSDAFTVALSGTSPVAGPVAITPRCDGPGRFEPSGILLSAKAPEANFRFIPDSIGTWRIDATNNAGLVPPIPITFVATVVIEPPEQRTPITPPPPRPQPLPGDPSTSHGAWPLPSQWGKQQPSPMLPDTLGSSLAAPPLNPRGSDEHGRGHRDHDPRRSLAAPPWSNTQGRSPSPRPPRRGS